MLSFRAERDEEERRLKREKSGRRVYQQGSREVDGSRREKKEKKIQR